MSNIIQFESIGLNGIAFDEHPSAGGEWVGRYQSVQLHHPKRAIQLPQYPVPSSFQEYLTGQELANYYSQAIQKLQLPCFAGIKVIKNVWLDNDKYWVSTIQDMSNGATMEIKTRNLAMSNGYMMAAKRRLSLPGEDKFQGSVKHSTEVEGSEPYTGKDVLIVGSGNSAHDIAGMIARSGATRSVSLLQRSPAGLLEHDQVMKIAFGEPMIRSMRKTTAEIELFGVADYFTDTPVDVVDLVRDANPTAVSIVMAAGFTTLMNQQSEELHRKLEEKGYLIDKDWNALQRGVEERSRSLYMDQPRIFDLVLEDKIHILRGSAKRFTANGLVTRYQNEEEKVIKTDAVIFATGYEDFDLSKEWSRSEFLDSDSAEKLVDVGHWGVDKEGEQIGYVTASGRELLSSYF